MPSFKDTIYVKPLKENSDEPTRHLYFGGVGAQIGTTAESFRELLLRFGELHCDEVNETGLYMPPDRRFCFASYLLSESAEQAFSFFRSEPDLSMLGNVTKVIVKFAQRADEVAAKTVSSIPECISVTEHVVVPGLVVIENFISEAEEMALMDELGGDTAPWKESISRRVQHYGFPFNYRTLMVDYVKPTPPLPSNCADLTHRITTCYEQQAEQGLLDLLKPYQPLNQLTINEYLPGQGIASHTGNHNHYSKPTIIKP